MEWRVDRSHSRISKLVKILFRLVLYDFVNSIQSIEQGVSHFTNTDFMLECLTVTGVVEQN